MPISGHGSIYIMFCRPFDVWFLPNCVAIAGAFAVRFRICAGFLSIAKDDRLEINLSILNSPILIAMNFSILMLDRIR